MRRELVSAPTVGAKGSVVGRPRKEPPADPREFAELASLLEDLAADGWSLVGVAWKCDVSKDVLSRWMREYPELLQAFEVGRERERRTLHNEVFRTATEEGKEPAVKLRAAMYLLNTRHGYSEPASDDRPSRVSVTVNLSAAMTPEQYQARVVAERGVGT